MCSRWGIRTVSPGRSESQSRLTSRPLQPPFSRGAHATSAPTSSPAARGFNHDDTMGGCRPLSYDGLIDLMLEDGLVPLGAF